MEQGSRQDVLVDKETREARGSEKRWVGEMYVPWTKRM